MDDANIIELYWARDPDAIAQTQHSYGRNLQNLAQNIVRNREDAEECAADTYLKTWETIPPQRPNYLFAYLAKICRRFAFGRLDWRNAAKRKAEIVSLTEEMALCIPDTRRDADLEGKEISRAMNAFLAELPTESRLIFLRRYWFCDSIAEIAARYRISESKVKTRLHRLRNQLRTHLEKEGITI